MTNHPKERIRSIDALRGFDMAMILGLREALLGIAMLFGWTRVLGVMQEQFVHPAWNGFTAWDLIFPLFLFLAGTSLPFSQEKRLAQGASRGRLTIVAIRRGLLLVFLGVVYNGLFGFSETRELRYASVLGRIGLGWLGAALLYLWVPRRGLAIAFVLLLAVHSLVLLFVPAPGLDAASLVDGETISDWLDRQLVPGRLHRDGRGDPEGIFGVVPAIGTALLGLGAGLWLKREDVGHGERLGGFAAFGAASLAAGWLLHLAGVPINKNLWTASFTLWAAGWSFLALGLFHLVFDIVRADRLALVFTVIGANAILAYLASAFISWSGLASVLFERGLGNGRLNALLIPTVALALQWAVLYALYKRRIFLRV